MRSIETKKFSEVLTDLIYNNEKPEGKIIQKIAVASGVPSGAISKYQNDGAEAGLKNVIKLARYFGVPTDYLLGLIPYKTTNVEIQRMCEMTGLSEKAINNIKQLYKMSVSEKAQNAKYFVDHKYRFVLNTLLESAFLSQFIQEAETLSRKYTALRDIFPDEKKYEEIKNKHLPETENFDLNTMRMQETIKEMIVSVIEKQYKINFPNGRELIKEEPKETYEEFLEKESTQATIEENDKEKQT